MRVPAADELFRPTVVPDDQPSQVREGDDTPPSVAEPTSPKPSGRVRHAEKMTVYVTVEEMLNIEHARLTLRRHHGLGLDRGRLVREAVAVALEDLDANAGDSVIVQRLNQP